MQDKINDRPSRKKQMDAFYTSHDVIISSAYTHLAYGRGHISTDTSSPRRELVSVMLLAGA